jgi:2-keto-3-deoxy-L-rhamnonate aldolase RhmA
MTLREKLEAGPCFGTFLKLPRHEVVDILALAGLDFVICDMEHAQMNEEDARLVARTCAERGLTCIVRLPEPTSGVVNRLLEAGATGIQMPRLQTSAEVAALVDMTRFPPAGRRSVGNANRLAGYGAVPIERYIQRANEAVLTVGQFETRAFEEPLHAVTEHLDVAFIGPVDLSVDYGMPGQADHPSIQEHIRKVEAAAARTGTVMGAFAGTAAQAERYLAAGYRFLAVSGDVTLLSTGAKELVNILDGLRQTARQGTQT